MQRHRITIFFLVSFTLFLVAPTVVSVIEKTYDTSVFFSVNEEEENNSNGEENFKKFEDKFFEMDALDFNSYSLTSCDNFIYTDTYNSFTSESVSPPPEYA